MDDTLVTLRLTSTLCFLLITGLNLLVPLAFFGLISPNSLGSLICGGLVSSQIIVGYLALLATSTSSED